MARGRLADGTIAEVRNNSVDRVLFARTGQEGLFWILIVPIAVLQAAALYFLRRPESLMAFRLAIGAVVAGAAETVAASVFSWRNPGLLREAIIASRTERGLAVRPEVLTMAESPAAQLFPAGIAVLLAVLWLTLIARYHRFMTSPERAA